MPPCNILYHTGANSRVYLAKQDPRYDFEVNAYGTVKLLEAAREAEIPKIIYTSSNSVYRDLVVKDEGFHLGINSYGGFYGLSKLTGDLYVEQYAKFYGFEYVILRPSNFYGPGMVKNVIIDIMKAYLENKDIKIGFTFDSEIDPVYIDDLVSGHLFALDLENDTFNLSYGASTKIRTIIELTGKCFDNKINVQEGINKLTLKQDNDKLRAIGWYPETDIHTGIENTVKFLKCQSQRVVKTK